MRTIYVASAGFGEGHNAAARGIVAALERLEAPGLRVEFLDLNARVHPQLDAWMRRIYLGLLSRAPRVWSKIYDLVDRTRWLEAVPAMHVSVVDELERLLKRQPAAAFVSTYPFYGYVLDQIENRGLRRDFPRITVVTDSISINSIWFRSANDLYLVPNEETADAMAARGVPREKIRAMGFPVHPRYADGFPPRPDVTDPEEGRRVLVIVNSRKHEAPELVRRLLAIPGVRVTATAGRDVAIKTAIEAEGRRVPVGGGTLVEVHGWTDRIPELLASHHVTISKAGGATVQEAIAAGCPLIMNQVAPGQEEGNAELLVRREAGIVAQTMDEVVRVVEMAFAGDAGVQRRWAQNIAALSHPAAALEIASFVLTHCTAAAPNWTSVD